MKSYLYNLPTGARRLSFADERPLSRGGDYPTVYLLPHPIYDYEMMLENVTDSEAVELVSHHFGDLRYLPDESVSVIMDKIVIYLPKADTGTPIYEIPIIRCKQLYTNIALVRGMEEPIYTVVSDRVYRVYSSPRSLPLPSLHSLRFLEGVSVADTVISFTAKNGKVYPDSTDRFSFGSVSALAEVLIKEKYPLPLSLSFPGFELTLFIRDGEAILGGAFPSGWLSD